MRNILTINIEDYFQVGAFSHLIPYDEWQRFEARIRRNTDATLRLLSSSGARATFFVSGWIAEKHPDIFHAIIEAGHEVASQGYYQQSIRDAPSELFRADVRRSKRLIETATGKQVVGFRVGRGWIGPDDLWALKVLGQEGFAYDSSVCPIGRQFRSDPERFKVNLMQLDDVELTEVPASSTRLLGYALPFAGGNYLRQLPEFFTHKAARDWIDRARAPLVMYFHIWELDRNQPDITAAGWLQRIRHYRNLGTMQDRIRYFLDRYDFTSVQDYLELSPAILAPAPLVPISGSDRSPTGVAESNLGTYVSIVVPCFNEEASVAYLERTLSEFSETTMGNLRLEFVFVDDGSTDATWTSLNDAFAKRDNCKLVRHGHNLGIASAILTGARHCNADLVAVIDADCTFSPFQIEEMLSLMTDDVTVVVASPFHRKGAVRNVPGWRLIISKTASFMYRQIMRNKLSSYTSCFRIYRRPAISHMKIRNSGFCGVTEILARLDLAGHSMVECPADLQVRLLGESKIQLFRVTLDHLLLIARLLAARLFATRLPRGHTP